MRIKEVCERTGLTDRAIRLYMENGLVSPKQETNYMGRRSYIFSEDDVRILETVATLRRADFSIADILQMQASADSIPEIVSVHRQKLARRSRQKKIYFERCINTNIMVKLRMTILISQMLLAVQLPEILFQRRIRE